MHPVPRKKSALYTDKQWKGSFAFDERTIVLLRRCSVLNVARSLGTSESVSDKRHTHLLATWVLFECFIDYIWVALLYWLRLERFSRTAGNDVSPSWRRYIDVVIRKTEMKLLLCCIYMKPCIGMFVHLASFVSVMMTHFWTHLNELQFQKCWCRSCLRGFRQYASLESYFEIIIYKRENSEFYCPQFQNLWSSCRCLKITTCALKNSLFATAWLKEFAHNDVPWHPRKQIMTSYQIMYKL